MRPTQILLSFPFLAMAFAASSVHGQIIEYDNDATSWMAAARCHEAYSFDRFYPGIAGGQGCVTGSTNPVTLQLASGTVTISVFNGAAPVCPLRDGSTNPQVCDIQLDNVNHKAVFEFDPPVTAFYTYYGSLAVGATGTMRLYQNNVLQGTIVSLPSPVHGPALGHGFDASGASIDRIEITTTDTTPVLVGTFVGLAVNEPSLGTTTINGYIGPGGPPTVQLDFGCTFVPEASRVHNITQDIWHWCIRDAIGWANNGDVLVAMPVVHHEAIDFKGKSITIRSANPDDPQVVEDTMINAGTTDWSAVRAVNSEGAGSQLVGLTVANGRGTLTEGQRRGGGLYALNSSPTIDRCHFIANNSEQPGNVSQASIARGGAIYLGDNCFPLISQCTFTGNSSYNGGAIFAVRGGWSVANCDFIANTATLRGGAISVAANTGPSVVDISGCLFEDNMSMSQGGAIAAFNVASISGGNFLVLEIEDSEFVNNHAGSGSAGGAIWSDKARFNIESCNFQGNSANNGGALMLTGQEFSAPNTVRNCFFRKNSAKLGDSGGVISVSSTGPGGFPNSISQCLFVGNHGISVLGGGNESTTDVFSCTFSGNGPDASVHARISPVYLTNSIIWDDVIPSVSDSFEGDVNINHCIIKQTGSSGGVSVLNADPRFVDPLGQDGVPGTGDENYRLMPDSPSINAGLGSHDPRSPEFDLDGIPRHQGAIDMGAYEFELDCNDNRVPDHQEIAQGQITDCNENMQADSCEEALDGNCNDVLDMCEIINGTLSDSNSNGVPDQFEVGGPVVGNVVWSVSNGPCIRVVTQDISVAGSLTINPGVRIWMVGGVKWTVLNGGSLAVNGSASEPIEFTSINVNPEAGDWGGIRYATGSNGSVSHAHIMYARSHGIRIEGAPVSVADCVISDIAGADQPRGTNQTPAQVGGAAYGVYVSGSVSPTLARNVIERVRGGRGGQGAFATGGVDGEPGVHADEFGEDAESGDNATTTGSSGVPGAPGGEAYGIYCGTLTNSTILSNAVRGITGGDGGIGGGGGSGGWGGDGGTGGHANLIQFPPTCSGGDGGDGGNASNGGNGAAAGNGANAYGIRLQSTSGASLHQNLVAEVTGGAGGQGGYGGIGGYGGNGGNGAMGYGGLCGTGPGVGGDSGDGGNGGSGGAGGQGGKAYGMSVGTTPQVIVSMAQNTIAKLQYGLPGPAGSNGPAGPAGAIGEGSWGITVTIASGYLIPIPAFSADGIEGWPGNDGLFGVPGGPGDLTGILAEGQVIVSLANSILASGTSSTGVGVTATGSASLTLNYTLLNGFQTPFGPGTSNQGLGNSVLNPMFVDAEAGDFQLSSASPAIDAGNNASIPAGLDFDLAGVERLFDGDNNGNAIVDLGAYEFQPTVDPCPADVNGDSLVNVGDLLYVISSWGAPGGPADINGDNVVNVGDLLAVISGWGSCP